MGRGNIPKDYYLQPNGLYCKVENNQIIKTMTEQELIELKSKEFTTRFNRGNKVLEEMHLNLEVQPNELYAIFEFSGSSPRKDNQKLLFYDLSYDKLKELTYNRYMEIFKGTILSSQQLWIDTCKSTNIQSQNKDEVLKNSGYSFKDIVAKRELNIAKLVIIHGYSNHDCCTYGTCPTCKASVQDGMAGTDHKCGCCGQKLKWH